MGIHQLQGLFNKAQRHQDFVDQAIAHQQDAPAVDAHQRIRPEGHDHQEHQQGAHASAGLCHQQAEGIAHGDADQRGFHAQQQGA